MRLLYQLKDHQYHDNGFNHTRSICRAVLVNQENKICLIHVVGDDIFGHRDYYETPGGGQENHETLISTIKRELLEEVGASINKIIEIGRVIDYYNLIYRENNNHYYLCFLDKLDTPQGGTNLEQELFQELVWVDIDEGIRLMKTSEGKIAELVKAREIPILEKTKKLLKKIDIL